MGDEITRQYRYVLDGFDDGLLFYYFGNLDQVSHMMWRPRDPGHPAYDRGRRRALRHRRRRPVRRPSIRSWAKRFVGWDPRPRSIVMSDHGFTSWRRSFHLNSWLSDNGYLAVLDPTARRRSRVSSRTSTGLARGPTASV